VYSACITLGETQCEQFHIIVNDDRKVAIHPQSPVARANSKIVGPDSEGKGLNWKIDGRAEAAGAGATYNVTFTWSFDWEMGESKNISWQRSSDEKQSALEFPHEYAISSSWTSWKLRRLIPSADEPGLHSLSARIGTSGQEEFQIVRDRDWSQVIYPAKNNPIKTNVPVRGPDENGSGKNWLVRGPPGFKVDIELRMHAGAIEVTQNIEKKGRKTWRSSDKDTWNDFYVSGSFNDWGLSLMTPDSDCVYRLHDVIVGNQNFEEFRIVVDKDYERSLYPVDGALCGPNAAGADRSWRIEGAEGLEFEIVYDGSTELPSVTWNRS